MEHGGTEIDKPKKHKLHLADYVELGKRWGTVLVVALAFFQSVYASYVKDEDVAKGNYLVQRQALEEFSAEVDVKMAKMEGSMATMEKLCIGVLQPKAPVPKVLASTKHEHKAKPNRVKLLAPVEIVPSAIEAAPSALVAETIETAPERKQKPKAQKRKSRYMDAQQSLKVRLPDAPWEQKDKK